MEGKFKVMHLKLNLEAGIRKNHELQVTTDNISYSESIIAINQIIDIFKKAEIENFELGYTRWDKINCYIYFTFDTSIDAYEAYEVLKEKTYFKEETDGDENGTQTQESCDLSFH